MLLCADLGSGGLQLLHNMYVKDALTDSFTQAKTTYLQETT